MITPFPFNRVRLTPDHRKALILQAALRVARDKGLSNMSHGNVADRCTVLTSGATVAHYYSTKKDLIDAVIGATDNPDEAHQWRVLAAQWGLA